MENINITTVRRGIERSMLLAPSRKQELVELLSGLSSEGLVLFAQLLQEEPDRIASTCALVIGKTMNSGDREVLTVLDRFVRESTKQLRVSEEASMDVDEAIKLEHFFDDIA